MARKDRRKLLALVPFLGLSWAFLTPPPNRSSWTARGSGGLDVIERSARTEEEVRQAQAALVPQLAAKEAQLRRAVAFKLPEQDGLQAEVKSLVMEMTQLKDELKKLLPEPVPEPEKPEISEPEEAEARCEKPPLSERLSWEKFQAMSNEEKLELTQELGPAFGVSVGIVAFIYWSITLPILLNAYHDSTGEWPQVQELFSLNDGGRTAGAVAGILGLAALLKPLRIAAAIALTPWTADNVLPLIPWLGSKKESDAKESE
ncbi:unnamed protein product [Effrenium voratum]|nr:unnamed protein product [Effrenium voratum]